MAKSKDQQPAYIKEIIKKHGNIILKGNELLEHKKDYKVVTISPAIDMALNGGIREGSWLMLSGAPKCGKAQPYSSIAYTPDGPKLMCDIEVGDMVCTPSGGVSKVIGVYPQGTRKVFKISFNDGSSCRCDYEHLWKVRHLQNGEWYVKTAEELSMDTVFIDRVKWALPEIKAMSFKESEQPIDPYLLGVLLSNGFISKKTIHVKIKSEIVEKNVRGILLRDYGCESAISINNLVSKAESSPLLIKQLNDLSIVLKKRRKFIPDSYKYSSIHNMRSIVMGIFDNAGIFRHTGILNFHNPSVQLMNNLLEVCRALGYFAKLTRHKNHMLINVSSNDYSEIYSLPFTMPDRSYKLPTKSITSIEPSHDEMCVCIEIEDEEHLYVTDGITATHNTTTAMQLAYQCQLEGRPVIYINSEGRLNELNFEVEGLDPEKMLIITAEDAPISAEVFLDVAHKLISVPENRGALCIIDSISSLIPEKDLDVDVTGTMRPGLPKILSNFVKKCGQVVPNNRNIMCMITHVIANTSGYGKSSMADGGIKIQFQADTRMEVKSVTPWVTSDKTRIGQAVKWTVYYSGLGAKSYECDSWIRYGHGIDRTQEVLITALELGLISQAGSWMTCDFLFGNPTLLNQINPSIELNEDGTYVDYDLAHKACKMQGQEKLYAMVKDTPGVLDYLLGEVKSILSC